MDLPLFHTLLSPNGQAALVAAAALGPTEAGFLACFEKLRKHCPPDLAKVAIETVLLRERGRVKFSLASRMYFTREVLEQASGEVVSRHRAGRFRAFARVHDLCCGAGADSISLATVGCQVEACDRDPLRLAMASENVAAHGLADRVRFASADVLSSVFPDAEAGFVDPSRRDGDRRFLDPDRYDPPLGRVLDRFPPGFPLAAKIAPGVARSDLGRWDAEAEFISVDGELKECVLWFGPLRTTTRRATVLPGPHTLADSGSVSDPPPSDIREFVFDPNSSVIRADLLGLLSAQFCAAQVDHGVAVLTGPQPADSPFAACYRVVDTVPFHLGKLRDYLREHRVGRVTVLKRGVDLDVNAITRSLKLDGPNHQHLILTRSVGRTVAVVAERVRYGESPGGFPRAGTLG